MRESDKEMYLLFLLVCSLLEAALITETVPIISGRNASTNTRNKLVSQKFTDIPPIAPCLHAVDHFSLPANLSQAINTFQVFFTILRMRRDVDPESITLTLLYDDPVKAAPGAVFFTKTVRAPDNPPQWNNDTVGSIESISLNITQGEISALDGITVFDFNDTVFLPRETRLWVGFYVTGERHFNNDPYTENVVFWYTTDQPPLTDDKVPYYYRDETDMMGVGFVNWTSAIVVEAKFSLNSGGKHMAFSLNLLAVVPTTILERVQALPLKELISIIICAILGAVVVVATIMCICKNCRRCRFAKKNEKIITHQLVPLYDPLASQPKGDMSLESLDQDSVSVSVSAAQMKIMNNPTKFARTPSTAYLETTSQIPINISNEKYKDK